MIELDRKGKYVESGWTAGHGHLITIVNDLAEVRRRVDFTDSLIRAVTSCY